jgi:hypothetical protein
MCSNPFAGPLAETPRPRGSSFTWISGVTEGHEVRTEALSSVAYVA